MRHILSLMEKKLDVLLAPSLDRDSELRLGFRSAVKSAFIPVCNILTPFINDELWANGVCSGIKDLIRDEFTNPLTVRLRLLHFQSEHPYCRAHKELKAFTQRLVQLKNDPIYSTISHADKAVLAQSSISGRILHNAPLLAEHLPGV